MKKSEKTRIVHTGMYSRKAQCVLDKARERMCNFQDKMFAHVERAPDKEVVLEIRREKKDYNPYYDMDARNGFLKMTDAAVREFFAERLKTMVEDELYDRDCMPDEWDRGDRHVSAGNFYIDDNRVGVSVSDARLIHDMLLGNEKTLSRYKIKQINEIVGAPVFKDKKKNAAVGKMLAVRESVVADWIKELEKAERDYKKIVERIDKKYGKRLNKA